MTTTCRSTSSPNKSHHQHRHLHTEIQNLIFCTKVSSGGWRWINLVLLSFCKHDADNIHGHRYYYYWQLSEESLLLVANIATPSVNETEQWILSGKKTTTRTSPVTKYPTLGTRKLHLFSSYYIFQLVHFIHVLAKLSDRNVLGGFRSEK